MIKNYQSACPSKGEDNKFIKKQIRHKKMFLTFLLGAFFIYFTNFALNCFQLERPIKIPNGGTL